MDVLFPCLIKSRFVLHNVTILIYYLNNYNDRFTIMEYEVTCVVTRVYTSILLFHHLSMCSICTQNDDTTHNTSSPQAQFIWVMNEVMNVLLQHPA